MRKAREAASLEFDGVTLSFFPDLSRETLERRRALKPLTEKLRQASITYRWVFPSALIASRDGKTAVHRFPEDFETFCMDLNIVQPELPGWQDRIPAPSAPSDRNWQKVSKKSRSASLGAGSQAD